jgi:hypothetical protein
MAQMGEEWPRWAGGGTKVTRLKLRRIKGLGPEPTSKSPHLAKNARYGAPGVEIVYARVQRKLLGRRCGLIVEADSLSSGAFMSLSRFVGIAALFGLLGAAFAANPPAAQTSTQAPPILPKTFGGWEMQGSAKTSTDPAAADPTNAAVFKEYRFTDLESSTYTRDDGRTLKIRAGRFADASGAFGAYTFYLQPEMHKESVGDQGASLNQRVLFYRGHVLVDAVFSQPNGMSAAELRELAGDLPQLNGSAGNLPGFIQYMPRRNYIANTQKYVMGPAALAALSAPVPAEFVDFDASSEVSLGRYSTDSGEATLMLISYPTPQLAAAHYQRIAAAHSAQSQAKPQEGVSTVVCVGEVCLKRTGTIIAIASGPTSAGDAKSLLGSVNWEANVTWNTPTENAQVKDLYMLVLNIVILCAILAGLAIVAGVAFGGIRILMKRYFPDRVFDRPEQMEFISLRLTETAVRGGSPTAPDGSHGAPQNPA